MLSADEIKTSLEEMIEYARDYHAQKKTALDHPRNRVELDMIEADIDQAQQVLDKIVNTS